MSSYQGYGFRGVDGGDLTADPHPLCPQEHATPARAEVCGMAHSVRRVCLREDDARWHYDGLLDRDMKRDIERMVNPENWPADYRPCVWVQTGRDDNDLLPICNRPHTFLQAAVCGLAHTRAEVHIVGEDRRWGIAIDEMSHTLTMDRLWALLWRQ